ncbi:MAG: tyrosine-type recombinase/integrase [Zoogloea sp.]|nr:tyrosine-type recombinase/integrase [Zoogloea sp.]
MARNPVESAYGVDVRGDTIRIRFSWKGKRYSETAPFPTTKAGITSAARLRDQVAHLIKLGLFDEAKYAELFPNSSNIAQVVSLAGQTFGEYAQIWLDSRSVTEGTRSNYKSVLNTWWMPKLAITPVSKITPPLLRKHLADLSWTSDGVKRNAMSKLSTILASAVSDGLLAENPMEGLELPKRTRKDPDPFTMVEADRIINHIYAEPHWPTQIYGAYFEFAFYTGMRPAEILALRWDEVDMDKKIAHVCRVVAKGKVHNRTKTNEDRYVLLNERALKALTFAKEYAAKRLLGETHLTRFPYCFPPSKNSEYVKDTSDLHLRWRARLKELGIRYRRPYNARHTYATVCLMSGMAPAFIAQQLGHSVQMLLTTYARWLNSRNDWAEMDKLKLVQDWSKTDTETDKT